MGFVSVCLFQEEDLVPSVSFSDSALEGRLSEVFASLRSALFAEVGALDLPTQQVTASIKQASWFSHVYGPQLFIMPMIEL